MQASCRAFDCPQNQGPPGSRWRAVILRGGWPSGELPLDRLCERFLRRCGRHRQRVIVQAGLHQEGHRPTVPESPVSPYSRGLRSPVGTTGRSNSAKPAAAPPIHAGEPSSCRHQFLGGPLNYRRVSVDVLTWPKRLTEPIVAVARPASVQANSEPVASVPATIEMPQAVIPTEIRYATAVSVSRIWARSLFISAIEGRKTQAASARGMRLQFAALCGATRHAEPLGASRELPCAAVLLVRPGSDQSDIFD